MTTVLFEFLVNVIEEGTGLLFISLYLGWKYKGALRVGGYIGATAVAVGLITYLNSIFLNEGIYSLIFVALYFSYAFFFLKGDIYNKLFIAAFTNALVYFIAAMSIVVFSGIFKEGQVFEEGIPRLVAVIVSKLLLISACGLLLKFKNSSLNLKWNLNLATIMPLMGFISVLGIITVSLEAELSQELFVVIFTTLFANSLIYYVFIKINKDMERESEAVALLQKYESDRKHAEEVEELYLKTCSIRHDMVNHLQTVANLINKDNEKALSYIESVTNNQITSIKSFAKTENDTLDAVINSKADLCSKKNINVSVSVMRGSLDKLKNYEIGIIFGNLFDNAIEGCDDCTEKRIEIKAFFQGDRTSIIVKNTIKESVLEKNKKLVTTKKEKAVHGFGIKNIRHIVEQYGGMINFFEENGFFGCHILI